MKNEKNILCSLDYYSVSLKFVQPKHLTFSLGFGNKYILLLNILIAKKPVYALKSTQTLDRQIYV